ncbi:MAG: hypothetical protein OHK0040_04890 [bacterium]
MKNLLVVDDSLTIRKVIEMLLVPMGYKLTFAESGKAALELLKSGNFEIALVDLGLPDINGVNLSKDIKKSYPNVKVLLMQSAKEEIEEGKLRDSLVDDVILKPFDSATIISKLEELLAKTEVVPEAEKVSLSEEEAFIEETFKLDLGVGEEFTMTPKEQKKEELEIEEIEELSDLELIEEEEVLSQKAETVSEEEISLEDLLEEGEIKLEEEPLIVKEEKPEEEVAKVNIEELFSDLNDILAERGAAPRLPEERPKWMPKDVKPVVEEVAKDLKELETVREEEKPEELNIEELEELDIWDFTPEEEKKEVQAEKPIAEPSFDKTFAPVETDRASLEKLIKEITYEVVEKIAWEVVPEIVDTIIKDRFGKK